MIRFKIFLPEEILTAYHRKLTTNFKFLEGKGDNVFLLDCSTASNCIIGKINNCRVWLNLSEAM